jgi:hypothetical protein
MSGSYIALRQAEQKRRQAEQQHRIEQTSGGDSYLPDFLD